MLILMLIVLTAFVGLVFGRTVTDRGQEAGEGRPRTQDRSGGSWQTATSAPTAALRSSVFR
jgi:hypothetical protein